MYHAHILLVKNFYKYFSIPKTVLYIFDKTLNHYQHLLNLQHFWFLKYVFYKNESQHYNKKRTSFEILDSINYYRKSPPIFTNSGANTSETTVISLISMFRDGPEVSLNGSPTVSPVTAALCASDPFPP